MGGRLIGIHVENGDETTATRYFDTVMLLALPAYSPGLNPVERIWLYLKERYLRR